MAADRRALADPRFLLAVVPALLVCLVLVASACSDGVGPISQPTTTGASTSSAMTSPTSSPSGPWTPTHSFADGGPADLASGPVRFERRGEWVCVYVDDVAVGRSVLIVWPPETSVGTADDDAVVLVAPDGESSMRIERDGLSLDVGGGYLNNDYNGKAHCEGSPFFATWPGS